MKRLYQWSGRWLVLMVVLLAFTVYVPTASAQDYRFEVPELNMQVYVQPDASVHIVYDISFVNRHAWSSIDVVDIGVPHGDYDLRNFQASIDGILLQDIRHSEYVQPGVEVHLRQYAISPRESGVFRIEFTMPDMVYQDTTRADYASLQITPTWFDGQFVAGSGTIQIAIHMLPDIEPEEVLYQQVPFDDKVIFEDRTVVIWRFPDTRATESHVVGVSFPQRGMTQVMTMTMLDLAVKWLEDNPNTRIVIGAVLIAILTIAFFRFSGGTGISVYVVLAGGLVALFFLSPLVQLFAIPVLPSLALVSEYRLRKRQQGYLPAIAHVEGGGIKRGLTAPEAAILLEMPLNKVLTLVIFGLLKKGVLQQVQGDPLVVELAKEFQTRGLRVGPARRANERVRVAQKVGVVLHSYEHLFLEQIEDARPGTPVHQIDFSYAMSGLIRHAAGRVKGFNLAETQAYYRSIIARAMREARSIGEIPEREKAIDRNLEWLLLDNDYSTVLETPTYQYRPIWVRSPGGGGRLFSPAPSASSGASAPGGRTSFGDVAASFAGWAESTMGNMASAVSPQALQLTTGQTGVIDLSNVDRVTADVFAAVAREMSSGSGGRSGGGCACAGCACACACAGGGR